MLGMRARIAAVLVAAASVTATGAAPAVASPTTHASTSSYLDLSGVAAVPGGGGWLYGTTETGSIKKGFTATPYLARLSGAKRTATALPKGVTAVNTLVASSASNAWAWVYSTVPATSFIHWNGKRWSAVTLPSKDSTWEINSLALSGSTLWIGGLSDAFPQPSHGEVLKHSGSSWDFVTLSTLAAGDVRVSSFGTNVWAVAACASTTGDYCFAHVASGRWKAAGTPVASDGVGVFAAGAGSEAWASLSTVSGATEVAHVQTSTVKTTALPSSDYLDGISPAGAGNAWLTGIVEGKTVSDSSALLKRWNGSRFTSFKAPAKGTDPGVAQVAAASSRAGWALASSWKGAVCASSSETWLLTWNGRTWTGSLISTSPFPGARAGARPQRPAC